ncbi:hypothetical protein OF117_01035 [Geodermatophilus sp. YIM 151500]|uniref:hypothetical protein n=1 Tax=Geodermatophilus sp. YIM 151500 TaxID=2984531 RepID=UPI0021E4A68B|nr:hypothetical protein [Geodermatophilus sp. YIM 151500]MCV2487932.1 hypothetical protein [Geodermatophilus sp. YIM 151500]
MGPQPDGPGAAPGRPSAAGPGTAAGVLSRASGVQLLGEMEGSGYRHPPALARRADGQVVQLTPLLSQVLRAVDGRRSVDEVAQEVSRTSGRAVRPEDVQQLVDRSLRPLGLLRAADGSEPQLRRRDPLLALKLRRVVTDPAVTRRLTAPFAVLFTPLLVAAVVLAFLAVSWWVLFSQGLAAATAQAFGNPALFLSVVVVTVLSAGFHEFGHAAAARYGGATPGVMGAGFYLFWPAFYTDVTDSYRLGRAGRVRTDLGGLYFNAIVVLLSFAVWWVTGWHAVLLLVATQILQMVRQLLPLLRFDGYHVLADLTGVPDLYGRIGPVLRGLVPGRRPRPEAEALRPWARALVAGWVLVVVPLMAAVLLLMVLALPRLLASAWASLREQAALLSSAAGDGDILGVLARALAMVALVVPLLGLGYVVVRLVRRSAAALWRRAGASPARRALVVALVASLVAVAGWAWWPHEDRYRPVRAWEGGTVLDAVPGAAGRGLAEGSRGAGEAIWPDDGGPLPTEDRPALALVLVPAGADGAGATGPDADPTPSADPTPTADPTSTADATGPTGAPGSGDGDGPAGADGGPTGAPGGGADATPGAVPPGDGAAPGTDGGGVGVRAPTWVFPFDRPLPPAEGDNQALAVNTTDGSVRYDVSFSLVWVDDETALNRNEAFAAASCRGCRTVAVAFQVVLLVGSVDVVVPQNLATAVNYACVECVTTALATQLVLTVDRPVDESGRQELAAIWAELGELSRTVATTPLAEIRDRLTRAEERIVQVVRGTGGPATPTGTSTATASGSSSPATGPSSASGSRTTAATASATTAGRSAGPRSGTGRTTAAPSRTPSPAESGAGTPTGGPPAPGDSGGTAGPADADGSVAPTSASPASQEPAPGELAPSPATPSGG